MIRGAKTKHKKPNGLMSGASVLATGSVVAKVVGALYRIPLTNVLGAEGMGMYQLVFPVFALFMVLSSAGVPTALSRIVAEKRALGQGVKKYLFASLIVLAVLSIVSTVLVLALARPIALWQGNENVALGFQIIAPSIFFVGIIAGFRGWFQGEMYMLPTALSNIIEQCVKLGLGLFLAVYMKPYGLMWSVAGAFIGVTVSEIVTMIYLIITYIYRERKHKVNDRVLTFDKKEGVKMFKIAFPIAIVAILLPLSNFFDSFIVVNLLKLGGMTTSMATSNYGLLSGPVTSLVNMPVVFIMSLAIAIVPSVSVSRAEHDINSILFKSRLSLKLAYTIGIPSAVFMMVFSKEIISVLYSSLDENSVMIASRLLTITAPNILIMSVMQIYVSLLQALDKTKWAVAGLGGAIVVKTLLMIVLVRFLGITGAGIAVLAMGVVALAVVNIYFVKLTSMSIGVPVAFALISGALTAFAIIVPKVYIVHDILALLVGFVLCYIMYFFMSILLGVLDKQEYGSIPMGKILLKAHRIIRFWEYSNGTQ
jgi:stage V sporulation protein B